MISDNDKINKKVKEIVEKKELDKSLKQLNENRKSGIALALVFGIMAMVLFALTIATIYSENIIRETLEEKVVFNEELNMTLMKLNQLTGTSFLLTLLTGVFALMLTAYAPLKKNIDKLRELVKTLNDEEKE